MDLSTLTTLFAQAEDTPTIGKVVYPPLMFLLVGVALYAALLRERTNPHMIVPRRIAVGVVGLSFILAVKTMLQLTGSLGPFYRDAINSKFTLLAHFFMPLICLAALAYVLWTENSLAKSAV